MSDETNWEKLFDESGTTPQSEKDREINNSRAAMAGVQDALKPIYEAAEGMRADLERRGFSPTIAEGLAAQFISEQMHTIFGLAMTEWMQGRRH